MVILVDSTCHHLISAGRESTLVYGKVANDEPQAFIEVSPLVPLNTQRNSCGDDSDDSDTPDFIGFAKNDPNIMLSTNRLLDYTTWSRYHSGQDWSSIETKVPPIRKRSHVQMFEVDSTFDNDPNWSPNPQSVPKRSRRRQ